jgi:hypothetical protein
MHCCRRSLSILGMSKARPVVLLPACAATGKASTRTIASTARMRFIVSSSLANHRPRSTGAVHGPARPSRRPLAPRPRGPPPPTYRYIRRPAAPALSWVSLSAGGGALNVLRRAAAMGRATDVNTGVMAQFLPRRRGGSSWTMVHGPCPPGSAPRPPGAVPSWLDALPAGSVINRALHGGIVTKVVGFVHLCRPVRVSC